MKKRTMIDIALMLILLIVLIILGKKDYKLDEKEDSRRFDKDYSMVSKDNVFKYINDEELYNLINKQDDAIVFMCFKENEWCNYYAKVLNETAKENGIETIYYYDFLIDREKQSTYYKKIVEYLKNYLKKDDTGKVNIVSPSMFMIKDKVITTFDDETSIVYTTQKPEEYWNEEALKFKTEQFKMMFDYFKGLEGGSDGGEE